MPPRGARGACFAFHRAAGEHPPDCRRKAESCHDPMHGASAFLITSFLVSVMIDIMAEIFFRAGAEKIFGIAKAPPLRGNRL